MVICFDLVCMDFTHILQGYFNGIWAKSMSASVPDKQLEEHV